MMAAEAHTIAELSRALKARDTTAEVVLERCLQRIAERNASLNAFITVFERRCAAQAREADREIAAGRIAVRCTAFRSPSRICSTSAASTTAAASRVRQDHVAGADAPSIAASA